MLSHYVKQDVDAEAYLICLFCRHKELGQTEECPKYNTLGGVRIGCTFADVPLPVFTDINFCLNGSSPEGPLKPTFASLQIQNHGKYNSCSRFDSLLAQLWFDRDPQHLYTPLHAITITNFFPVFLMHLCSEVCSHKKTASANRSWQVRTTLGTSWRKGSWPLSRIRGGTQSRRTWWKRIIGMVYTTCALVLIFFLNSKANLYHKSIPFSPRNLAVQRVFRFYLTGFVGM